MGVRVKSSNLQIATWVHKENLKEIEMASRNDLLSQDFIGEAEEIVAADEFTRRSSSLDDRSSALMDSSDDDDDDDDDDDSDEELDVENVDGDDNTYSELIDIREPLGQLKESLAGRVGHSLKNYDFWLQETQMLSDEMTLVEQCIQGEGLVQIKVEISNGKINIVDVLKPEEDLVTESKPPDRNRQRLPSGGTGPSQPSKSIKMKKDKLPLKAETQEKPAGDSVTRWVVSTSFRKQQEQFNFPTDPLQWERIHVQFWLNWVQGEFPDSEIDQNDWDIDGRELCALSHDEFKKKVPIDPGDTLWTHLELLRKCKFVAVIQRGSNSSQSLTSSMPMVEGVGSDPGFGGPLARKTLKKPPVRLGAAKFSVMSESSSPGNRTGNNGQVQLWQFLLELLTDKQHCEVIHWVGEEGEFKLESPEIVAQLWGTRKNKPNMNYEKLSRALRYYYDGDMISKVHGKRFVYKFVCDLKGLIGYTASELNSLVIEAEQKANGTISVFNQM